MAHSRKVTIPLWKSRNPHSKRRIGIPTLNVAKGATFRMGHPRYLIGGHPGIDGTFRSTSSGQALRKNAKEAGSRWVGNAADRYNWSGGWPRLDLARITNTVGAPSVRLKGGYHERTRNGVCAERTDVASAASLPACSVEWPSAARVLGGPRRLHRGCTRS